MKLINGKIISIEKINLKKNKIFYDLEVEDNKNFFANDFLVHNSGTSFRCDGNTMKMNAALGYSIKNSVRLKDLIEWKYLVDFSIEEYEIEGVETQYMTYNEVYDEQITNNKERNKKIFELAKKNKRPVIIFIDKILHGENLLKIFPEDKTVLFTGQMKKKDRDKVFEEIIEGKYDYIISSKVLREGVNINSLRTLILAGSGKSSIKVVQQLGRVLRTCKDKEKAKLIHFHDDCKYLKKHYQERVDVLMWEKYRK